MSKSNQQISVKIQICSNCKQHAWCTRHNQANYLTLAQQIVKSIRNQDSNIKIQVLPVGGTKMGSFQITCQQHVLFSKLSLGYFPHVKAVTQRILAFIKDYKSGNDLSKYEPGVGSPIRSHSNFNRTSSAGFQKSPPRRQLKIAYNQQYGKKQQNQSHQNHQIVSNKQQQKNQQSAQFIVEDKKQQKKSEKKIQRRQVIIPQNKKQQNKSEKRIQRGQVIISQNKKQQKKNENFIINHEQQNKKQSQKHSQKQLKSKHQQSQKASEKKIQAHDKKQQQNETPQFVISQQKQQQSKKDLKIQTPSNANDQPSDQKVQTPLQVQQHKQQKNDKKFKNIQKADSQLIKEMKKIFNQYDKDNSGYLQKKQVKQLMKAVLADLQQSNLVTDQASKNWLSSLDTDGDGKLSFEQMVQAFCVASNK